MLFHTSNFSNSSSSYSEIESSTSSSLPSRCGFSLHKPAAPPVSISLAPDSPSHSRFLTDNRAEDWDNLRIQIHYISLDIPDSEQDYIKHIVSGSVKWYENTLKVHRIKDKLKFSNVQVCDEVAIPEDHKDVGVDADMILYVSAGKKSNQYVGYALYCINDIGTGQPVAGHLYLDTTSIDKLSDEDFYATAIHEMAHALAFNPELYPSFLKPDGKVYTVDEMFVQENVDGVPIVKIKTPNVLQKARESFKCDDLDGVDLESQGGDGTKGSHWEKRIMNDDFMVADSDINDVIYSDITMALFEDSGWYQVDYSYTTPLLWGRHQGCDFLDKVCVSDGRPSFKDFCSDNSETSSCDYKNLNKGVCNLVIFDDPLPSQYQYFSNPDKGGSDKYLNYCPVVKQYKGGNCRGLEKTDTVLYSIFGEEACEDCRCVEGTYVKQGNPKEHAGCHRVECFDDRVIIHIGDEKVTCNFDENGDVKVPDFEGVVHCRNSEKLCDPKPCLNNCSGVGKCISGTCECPDGSKGGDCGYLVKNYTVSATSGSASSSEETGTIRLEKDEASGMVILFLWIVVILMV
jgi:leishmanolysin